MLLKIFIPMGILILPILLPLNRVGGKGKTFQNGDGTGPRWNVSGLDQLAWGNVKPEHTSRYWAHLVMAVVVIVYVCAVFFDELRGYIRLRQAYMTSPQHRLRASATTVLITTIPSTWLTVDALMNVFDIFPGGIRNIWINRNFDDLNEKVRERYNIALKLEEAETNLIANCKKAALKKAKAEAKKSAKSKVRAEGQGKMATDQRATQLAMGPGVSSGDPHQAHTLREELHRDSDGHKRNVSDGSRARIFDPALAAAGALGQGVENLGKSVLGGLKKVEGGFDSRLSKTGGFVETTDDLAPPRIPPPPAANGNSPADAAAETVSAESNSTGPSQPHDARPHAAPRRPSWKTRISHHSKTSALEPDQHPLTGPETPVDDSQRHNSAADQANTEENSEVRKNRREGSDVDGGEYPMAYNEEFDNEDYGEPKWKDYIRPADRETMRLPIFGWKWMPSLWLVGQKVDTIDHCRKELARLNLEIEIDQQHPERFPLMNSAFIQFNHQVAAHMACQSVAHHLPKQMAPRVVEISPDDVIWDNMSIKWWERYLRTFGIFTLVCAMVIGWAFPVAFTGLLSQLTYLEGAFSWLAWIRKFPNWLISAIQGVLPPLCLAILMALLPLILRFLSRTQGLHTGMEVELTVQNYYFAFLFMQLFLVVTIASSIGTILANVTNVTSWPTLLAQNIPKASNYFFSYMILQAMSVSAGALLQIFGLISWFVLAPIMDATARKKWARTTNLNQMQWGSFFPMYTTLAAIGKRYFVIYGEAFANPG